MSDSDSDSGASVEIIEENSDEEDDRAQYAFLAKDADVPNVEADPETNLSRWLSLHHRAEDADNKEMEFKRAASMRLTGGTGKRQTLSSVMTRTKLSEATSRLRIRKAMGDFATNSYFTAVMTVATVWALCANDLQVILIPPEDDLTFAYSIVATLGLFLCEFICLSAGRTDDYVFSFFFWMDLLAVLSLVPDTLIIFGISTGSLSSLTLARVGRFARTAGRTARFARIVKVMNVFKKAQTQSSNDDRYNWLDGLTQKDYHRTQASQERLRTDTLVGEYMQDVQFQKLFITLLATFVALTLLDGSSNHSEEFAQTSLGQIQQLNGLAEPGRSQAIDSSVAYFLQRNQDTLRLVVNGVVYRTFNEDHYRESELLDVSCEAALECNAVLDTHGDAVIGAYYNLGLTAGVILLVVGGSAFMYHDLKVTMLQPLEKVVAIVKLLAINPLATLRINNDFTFETHLMEVMFAKMAVLLQISLGAAGSKLISANLSSSGRLVPLSPGTRVEAIFGVCEMRDFVPITEALQEEMSVLVNIVAARIHGFVAAAGGFPYSNNRGVFSFVWLLPKRDKFDHEAWRDRAAKLADNALQAMVKIKASLLHNTILIEHLKKVPDVSRVRVGFGLHTGWAIVGPVGSPLKVDATYLSHDVEVAHMLPSTGGRAGYGVDIMLSGELFQLLSHQGRAECMMLNRASLLGSNRLFSLYGAQWDPFKVEEDDPQELLYRFLRGRYVAAFSKGLELYLAGEWMKSKASLEEACEIAPRARAPAFLLETMAALDFKVASDWRTEVTVPVAERILMRPDAAAAALRDAAGNKEPIPRRLSTEDLELLRDQQDAKRLVSEQRVKMGLSPEDEDEEEEEEEKVSMGRVLSSADLRRVEKLSAQKDRKAGFKKAVDDGIVLKKRGSILSPKSQQGGPRRVASSRTPKRKPKAKGSASKLQHQTSSHDTLATDVSDANDARINIASVEDEEDAPLMPNRHLDGATVTETEMVRKAPQLPPEDEVDEEIVRTVHKPTEQ